MSAQLIYAIHGFLGRSSDWDFLKNAFLEINVVTAELFSSVPATDTESFRKLDCKKIFLGYSLGGRLGLKILKNSPDLFDHYIFLSTNAGLPAQDKSGRQKRLVSDQKWSDKIYPENWAEFLKEWNAQAVFEGSGKEPERTIGNYDLQKLKTGLTVWSLAEQEDFSEIIKLHKDKITWVVGNRDKKYCELAEQMKKKEILSGYEKISSGHRIWLDNTEALIALIRLTILQKAPSAEPM